MTTTASTSAAITLPPIPPLRPAAAPVALAPQQQQQPDAGKAAVAQGKAAAPKPLVNQQTALAAQESEDCGTGSCLSKEEQMEVRDLKRRDAEVRRHEQAHAATGGQHAGSPNFTYERGPDGRSYAVAGHVAIDVSPVQGDPKATIRKMETVQRAANAPADPSSQDRAVAAKAQQAKLAAQRELAQSGGDETAAPGQPAANANTAPGNTDERNGPAPALPGYGQSAASRIQPLISLVA